MVEIVCNLYEMEGISKVTLSQIMWCHISCSSFTTPPAVHFSRTLQRRMRRWCSTNLISTKMASSTKMSLSKAAWRFVLSKWNGSCEWIINRKKLFKTYYWFQDSALQDLLNGSAEWYKSTIYEWVEEFVITSENCLWQTYLQMIPRMILRLWYKWLEALKWSYDSLAQYFPSDSYALKQSCVIWVKWCPIALAEMFRINKLIKFEEIQFLWFR